MGPRPRTSPMAAFRAASWSESSLDLVVDEEHPVGVADLFQPAWKVRRHLDETALTLHGLEHDARDRRGIDVLLQQQLEAADRIVGRDAAKRVWSGGTV